MRCGSILGKSSAPLEVYPPRMPRWARPLRGLLRFFRLNGIQIPKAPQIPAWVETLIGSGLFAVFFSIVPGLAQLLTRKFRSIWIFWVSWLFFFAATGFFWGSSLSWLLCSLMLASHAWIAMRAGILSEIITLRSRVFVLFGIILLYFAIYRYGVPAGLNVLGFSGGYSLTSVDRIQVATGDYLFGTTRNLSFQRGDMAMTEISGTGGHFQARRSTGFVEIVGLPGETLEVKDGLFIINNKPLDQHLYPVPGWIKRAQRLNVTLGSHQYFVVADFHGTGYNSSHVTAVCVVPSERLQARAFLQWWPLRNRGFIETAP